MQKINKKKKLEIEETLIAEYCMNTFREVANKLAPPLRYDDIKREFLLMLLYIYYYATSKDKHFNAAYAFENDIKRCINKYFNLPNGFIDNRLQFYDSITEGVESIVEFSFPFSSVSFPRIIKSNHTSLGNDNRYSLRMEPEVFTEKDILCAGFAKLADTVEDTKIIEKYHNACDRLLEISDEKQRAEVNLDPSKFTHLTEEEYVKAQTTFKTLKKSLSEEEKFLEELRFEIKTSEPIRRMVKKSQFLYEEKRSTEKFRNDFFKSLRAELPQNLSLTKKTAIINIVAACIAFMYSRNSVDECYILRKSLSNQDKYLYFKALTESNIIDLIVQFCSFSKLNEMRKSITDAVLNKESSLPVFTKKHEAILFKAYIVIAIISILSYIVAINTITTKIEVDDSPTVYITEYGDKYHRRGCGYLRDSSFPYTVLEADSLGYSRCSECRPVRAANYDFDYERVTVAETLSFGDMVGELFQIIASSIMFGLTIVMLYPLFLWFKEEKARKRIYDKTCLTVGLVSAIAGIVFLDIVAIAGMLYN